MKYLLLYHNIFHADRCPLFMCVCVSRRTKAKQFFPAQRKIFATVFGNFNGEQNALKPPSWTFCRRLKNTFNVRPLAHWLEV